MLHAGHAKFWLAPHKSGEVEEDSLGSPGLGVDAVHLDKVPLLIVWPVELQIHVKSELCLQITCRDAGHRHAGQGACTCNSAGSALSVADMLPARERQHAVQRADLCTPPLEIHADV